VDRYDAEAGVPILLFQKRVFLNDYTQVVLSHPESFYLHFHAAHLISTFLYVCIDVTIA